MNRKQSFSTTAIAAATFLALLAGCSSTSNSSASSPAGAEPTTIADSATTTGEATTASTVPATAAPTTAGGGGDACDGVDGIPVGAEIGATIFGDIDGDLADDTVTEFSIDGVPHVHSQLASGGQSNVAVPIGNSAHVEISTYDFDYSIGAPTKPAVAVLAIGSASAGSAVFAILTNTIHYCIQPWHTDGGEMFVGRISAQGPYEGLFCDHAAGSVYNNLTTAEPDGVGGWNVTTTLLHHNFTLVTMDAPQAFNTTGSESEIQAQYGDISGCDHPSLFA